MFLMPLSPIIKMCHKQNIFGRYLMFYNGLTSFAESEPCPTSYHYLLVVLCFWFTLDFSFLLLDCSTFLSVPTCDCCGYYYFMFGCSVRFCIFFNKQILCQNCKIFLEPVKTGPSLADAAVGRIAQGTKVLAEGGYEKIFQQNFETVPGEQLQKTYACYLSTSAGPVMGILYLSTSKLAFCSDSPLSYKTGDQTEWSYYKVDLSFYLHVIIETNVTSSFTKNSGLVLYYIL